jgi:uncharacterized membrane protein YeiB
MHLFAYLDPGSGSIIIQAVIAAMIGAGFYFRRFIIDPACWLWRLVTGRKAEPQEQQQQS